MDINGPHDLTLIAKACTTTWDIPAHVMATLPQQMAEIATGAMKAPNGTSWSMRSRFKAARILGYFAAHNIAAGRLMLDAWKAQQPGNLSVHNLAHVVDQFTRAIAAELGDTDQSRSLIKQVNEEILHAAHLEHGTTLLPGDVDEAVQQMDDSIPEE